jgi:hypothetical protein
MKALKIYAAVVLLTASPLSMAATGVVNGAIVTKILTNDGGSFGGCMVLLDKSVNAVLSTCSSSWVTFSCTGDHTSTARANTMLETAKMAYALGKPVQVSFTDAKKHNSYCFAYDIRAQ